MVEAQKRKNKGKETEERNGKEMEKIVVKRGGKTKKAEMDKLMEVLERMAESMERIADRVESLVEGQERLIVEQRSMGLGLEVLIQVMEEKQKMDKGKGKEEVVELSEESEKTEEEISDREIEGEVERDGEGDAEKGVEDMDGAPAASSS